jgi:hypothetical protein
MWWIIDLVELSLKLVLWLYVVIFLHKIYHIVCNMAYSQNVLDEALAELGLEDADDKPSDACGSTTGVEHRRALIGLSQSGLLQKIGIKNTESQLISMTDAEVAKVYSEYQRRYLLCVSDDVVDNILHGYAAFCQWLAPETEKEKLAK